MKNEKTLHDIIEKIAEKDINKLLSYETLVFDVFFTLLKNGNKFNEEELNIIKRAFAECKNTGAKIEGISRYRRVLTGITKSIKGRFYNEFNYAQSLEKEKQVLEELGY